MQVDRAPGEPLHGLFEDLEQLADGLHLRDRDEEVDELGRAEYSSIDILARLHGSVDASVGVTLLDGLQLTGRLVSAGADFVVIEDSHGAWLVRPAAVTRVRGLSERAVSESARRAVARLGLTAMLRRLADDGVLARVHLAGGERPEGRVGRVGSDFFELSAEGASGERADLIGIAAVTAIRTTIRAAR